MKGATIVVKSLEDLGVKHVFGYTGAAILPIIDELAQSSIEIVVNTNEQAVAFWLLCGNSAAVATDRFLD